MLGSVSLDNESAWRRRGAAFSYRHASALFAAEIAVIERLSDRLSTARVLDVGIGTGRTTGHLAHRCARYTGVDYSPEMVARARVRYPQTDIRTMDARDLSVFPDDHFDIVFFSYNGIDYVDHADRLRIMSEIRRVLTPGGVFAFSAHRRGVAVPAAVSLVNLRLSANPAKTLRGAARYLQGIWNARRMRPRQRSTAEYALVNDAAQEYQLLTYYIAPQDQKRQLLTAGFHTIRAFAQTGDEIDPDTCYAGAASDYMVHYLAVRA